MPHLSELHGAATHLAVVAIPLFAILHLLRRIGRGGAAVAAAEPWALGGAILGIAASGITGLLVWGEAQTTLRGQDFRLGTIRSSVGFGVRLNLPIFGQLPLALDFGIPITKDSQDDTRFISFSLGYVQ